MGENARRIREEGDARQDDVAVQARALGLSWTRSKLAALERGDKAIDLPEMVLLAAALSQATDAPVRLSDLLEGDDWVQLSGKTPHRPERHFVASLSARSSCSRQATFDACRSTGS